MSPISIIAAITLSLGAVEATAYWWMHPAPAGRNQPVLTYQPSSIAGVPTASETANGELPTDNFDSSSSTLDPQLSTSSITQLPGVVDSAIPALRSSTGIAARIDRDDGVTVHLAFFEWDLADSTNVLEAFKHLPDECMGSIGLKLTAQPPPRSYRVGAETLWFDHTVFKDTGGVTVHAFKGTWVSGAGSLIGNGERGGVEQWNQLRWKSALKRFHPAHARVAQGAVRGIPNSDFAWQAFETAMLKDLTFQ